METPIYSLQIVDYCCATALQTQKEIIRVVDQIQSFHGLAVSLFSAYGLYQHWICDEPCILLHVPAVVLCQLVVDLCLIKRFDLLVHHIAAMGVIGFYIFYLPPLPPIYLSVLVSTELSTIFLIIDNVLGSFPKKINGILFVASFLYTRIYLYSKYLLFDPALHEKTVPLDSIGATVVFFSCIYGLFGVNTFWAVKILKKMYASATHEYWMQYAHFLSPCISWFVYCRYINWKHFGWIETCIWLDLLGQVLLSLCSFQLHQTLFIFSGKDLDLLPYKYFALNEMAAKHVRSFLFVLAKYVSIQQSRYSPNVAVFCGLYGIHIVTLSYIIHRIMQSKTLSWDDIAYRINQYVFLLDVFYVVLYTEDFSIAALNICMISLQMALRWDQTVLEICTTLPLALSLAEHFPLPLQS